MKSTQKLQLKVIRQDSGTQSRMRVSEDTINDYAERMQAGDQFPPLDVFFDGSEYNMADGFHRALAAMQVGISEFDCVVHKGNCHDALWFAMGANKSNGERMSAGDKRYSVSLALATFPEKTQQEIADHVGCTQQYVAKVQSELTTSCKLKIPEKRTGKDGKEYKTSYAKRQTPEPAPAPEPEPEVAPEPEAHIEDQPELSDAIPSPAEKDHSEDWRDAVGVSDARQYFAAQLEDTLQACVDDGSEDQLSACKLVCEVWARKIRKIIH